MGALNGIQVVVKAAGYVDFNAGGSSFTLERDPSGTWGVWSTATGARLATGETQREALSLAGF